MNDADHTQGGESGQAQDQTVDKRYSEFTRAQDAWESALNMHGEGSRQERAAWDQQIQAWNSYTNAGGKSSLGPQQSGRRVPGGRAGGRRSTDPRNGNGGRGDNGLKGPNSPPVDQ